MTRKTAVHRLRSHDGRCPRREIADTLLDPDEVEVGLRVEEELRHLLAAVR